MIALAICFALAFSLTACMDLGVGESADALSTYFSGVYVLSKSGLETYSIREFNRDISIENSEIPTVVGHEEYCYIGFCVANGYTITLSEFAFFAKTETGSGVLDLELYAVDKMPTSIEDEDDASQTPPSDGEDGEEEDLFPSENSFHTSTFSIGEEWNSVLLKFDGTQTVKGGEYVIVRVKNNCFADSDGEALTPVAFTFNYLLFYINNAHKQ